MVQYLPAPTHLVYLVFFVVFLLQVLGVALMPETVTPRPGALASMRPHLRLPPVVRRPFLLAAPVLIAAWALAGFYGSLGPALVRRIVGAGARGHSAALGGLTLFVLAGSGALTVLTMRKRSGAEFTIFGATVLLVGVGLTLVAASRASAPLFFVGAVLAGMGFGAGFQGAIRTVLPLTEPHERAGVLSVLYVVSYLAMGVPAVAAGFRVVHGGGLPRTARDYGVAVMILAALALVGALARRPPTPNARA